MSFFTYHNALFNSSTVAFACPRILEAEAEEPRRHWETSQSQKKAGRETDDKQKWEGINFMFLTFFPTNNGKNKSAYRS